MWNICDFNKVIMVLAGFLKKVTTEIAVIWLKGGQFIKGSVLHNTNNGKGERKNRESEESEKKKVEWKKNWFFVFILAAVELFEERGLF